MISFHWHFFSQLEQDSEDFIQLDGASLHYYTIVWDHLKKTLLQQWIGRAGVKDQHLLLWSPCSPNLTPCDFLMWGFVKDRVYVPPLPTTCTTTLPQPLL